MGFVFLVQGLGFGVQGSGFRVKRESGRYCNPRARERRLDCKATDADHSEDYKKHVWTGIVFFLQFILELVTLCPDMRARRCPVAFWAGQLWGTGPGRARLGGKGLQGYKLARLYPEDERRFSVKQQLTSAKT